jgi:hypothetical protein
MPIFTWDSETLIYMFDKDEVLIFQFYKTKLKELLKVVDGIFYSFE